MNFCWNVCKILIVLTSLFFAVKENAFIVDDRFSSSVQIGVLLYAIIVMPFFALALNFLGRKLYKSTIAIVLFSAFLSVYVTEIFINNGFLANDFEISYTKCILIVYIIGGYCLSLISIIIENRTMIFESIFNKSEVHVK